MFKPSDRLKIKGSASSSNLLGKMSNARHEEMTKRAMHEALEKKVKGKKGKRNYASEMSGE